MEITTNNRVRAFKYDDGGNRLLSAYGYTFAEDELQPASDYVRAEGYDDVLQMSTNAGTACILIRWFDRDGYELDGYVAGWTYGA